MAKSLFIAALFWASAFSSSLENIPTEATTATSAAPTDCIEPTRLPGNDSFYAPPAGYESKALGSILKFRNAPKGLSIDNISQVRVQHSIQIQYRTQNSVGCPAATVVTVLVPYFPNNSKLLVYGFFSDASCPDCNPSISLQDTNNINNTFYKLQLVPIVAALNQGWIVSVADDGGPQAAFPSGLMSGYATLDSIRALLQSGSITGLSTRPRIVMTGYSGGGITISWATELQPSYAPELNIAGAALGGLIPNFQVLQGMIPFDQSLAVWAPPVLQGLSHDYKNLSDWLNANLVPSLAARFRATDSLCLQDTSTFYANDNMGAYFVNGYPSWNESVPSSVVRSAGVMGQRGTPKIPWYLYESVGDNISPVALTEQLYAQYCRQGANIYYEENQLQIISHDLESVAGFPGAWTWMRQIMAGGSAATGCRQVNVTTSGIFQGSYIITNALFETLLALLGVPVS